MNASRSVPQQRDDPRAVRLGGALGLVAIGGALGTLARYGLGVWWADAAVTTLVVNLVGAFVLGALITMLGRLGARGQKRFRVVGDAAHPSAARAERLRLLLGTGVLGGFTTYSGLAVETGQLVLTGQEIWAIGYAGVTLIAGLAASIAGLWFGGLGSGGDGRGELELPAEPGAQ